MLDLIVVAIVMMSNDAIVMIAVVLLCGLCELADVLIGQRFHRVSKPRVMGDTTAEQHGRSSEGLQRQRQQQQYDGALEKAFFHKKIIP